MSSRINYTNQKAKIIRLYFNKLEMIVNSYDRQCILRERKLIISGVDHSINLDHADHDDVLFRKFQYEWNLLIHQIKIYKVNSKLAIKQSKHDGDNKITSKLVIDRKARLAKFEKEKKALQHKYYILMLDPLKSKLFQDKRNAKKQLHAQLALLKKQSKQSKKTSND